MWSAALSEARKEWERLEHLCCLLSTFRQRAPPPVPPPSASAARAPRPAAPAPPALAQTLNRFAALGLEDEDAAPAGPEAGESGEDSTGEAEAASCDELQARYLLLQGLCLQAELLRAEAAALGASKSPGRWSEQAEALRRAYVLVAKAMGDRIDWWDALAQHQEDPSGPLPYGHVLESLLCLCDALNLEQTTLGEMKTRAQHAAENRLAFVERKLNPAQEERDGVRTSMGDDKWKNNPAPKMTYAERIAQLKEEQADLLAALALLESLSFARV